MTTPLYNQYKNIYFVVLYVYVHRLMHTQNENLEMVLNIMLWSFETAIGSAPADT